VEINAAGDLVINDPALPTREDIGLLLILLLAPGKLPLIQRAVLLLLLYSVQRRYTVACALHKVVLTYRSAACGVWVLDGGTTKGGLPHILPFSEVAAAVIEEFKLTLPAKEDWLFPSLPTRAKPRPSGHINVRTINAWLESAWKLAGASRVYSPHKIRKAFQSYLSALGVSLTDRKLVVDHTEGRANDVTEEHYNLDPKFEKKLRVINIWNQVLQECVDRAKRVAPSNDQTIVQKEKIDIEDAAPLNIGVAPAPSTVLMVTSPTELLSNAKEEQTAVGLFIDGSRVAKASSTDPVRLEILRRRLEEREALDKTLKQLEKQND
jgi:hypothetical protein